MDIEKIVKIDDDLKRNEELYNLFDEESRLKSRTGLVEKITTQREIDKLINANSTVLDIGAGTGVYTIHLAPKVKEVISFEPASSNFKLLKSKSEEFSNIKSCKKSSYDLKDLEDNYFDLVLIFGPMYHLSNENDRTDLLRQAKRICKDYGHILISYINHDMVLISESINYNTNIFSGPSYDSKKQRLIDRPFVFFKLNEARAMIEEENLEVEEIIASDGFAEVLASKLNEMTEESFKNYLDWHLSHCKDPETLGASNHFLFVCRNKK
ncbi:bifunctional 2-polyprenyl-6-hydroxyphenol methylase/3-demethylubiquinol 3-O-methyltransferase UbiG [uncultured Anaerococcus sp.]|uniref:class I SAM-dependent methyltransferase n=1 Tax=uncultured Anaerococcus sp. TaxID=293428 RepID=UPI0025D22CBC|nr:class I SAM-dependent methyltransferase [uncultured Anaerococcus sp.]